MKLLPHQEVKDKIVHLRKQDVILDFAVAELYGVETREINQAVKNNPNKFPEGYVFEVDKQEFADLRSKNLIANNLLSWSKILTALFFIKHLAMAGNRGICCRCGRWTEEGCRSEGPWQGCRGRCRSATAPNRGFCCRCERRTEEGCSSEGL